MRFLPEQAVPERTRMLRPVPKADEPEADATVEAIDRLTAAIQAAEKPEPMDMTPVIHAIQAARPTPAKAWVFTIGRDAEGLITTVTAERKD